MWVAGEHPCALFCHKDKLQNHVEMNQGACGQALMMSCPLSG